MSGRSNRGGFFARRVSAVLVLVFPLLLAAGGLSSERAQALQAVEEGRAQDAIGLIAGLRKGAESQHDLALDRIAAAAYEQLGLAPLALLGWQAVALEATGELATESEAAIARLEAELGGSLDWAEVVAGFPSYERPELKQGPVLSETAVRGVSEHLGSSRCIAARFRAAEWVFWDPEAVAAYKALGDSERCWGKLAPAARAYRRYQELGGAEVAVEHLLSGLRGSLGSLSLQADLPEGQEARFQLKVGGQRWSGFLRGGQPAVLEHLPVGRAMVVEVTGLGISAQRHELPPLIAGQTQEHSFPVEQVGLGKVQVVGASSAELVLLGPMGPQPLPAGQAVETTAGSWKVRLSSELGEVEVPVSVQEGETFAFDPLPLLPTSLSLTGVPAGSTVRVFVEGLGGEFVEREVTIPELGAKTEPTSGIPLAPVLRLNSLLGGSGGLFVEHPLLGGLGVDLGLLPGQENALSLDWKSFEGVALVQLAYRQWQEVQETEAARLRKQPLLLAGFAVATGAGAAAAFVGALVADQQIGVIREQAQVKASSGDLVLPIVVYEEDEQRQLDALEELNLLEQRYNAALIGSRVLAGFGIGLGTVALSSGVAALLTEKRRAKRMAALDPWDPWASFTQEENSPPPDAPTDPVPASD